MKFFSKLFGKGKDTNQEEPAKEEDRVVYVDQNKVIEEAYQRARDTFKYFWRERYWEHRRVVPAHDLAMVKVPFQQEVEGEEEPHTEHMWVNDIHFDGEFIYGILANTPNYLTNVAAGDQVSIKPNKISDWMYAIGGQTYGAFTVQAMRATMSKQDRAQHDKAWGLDFGNPNQVLTTYKQQENPENLIEHPMSKNMEEKVREFLQQHPQEITHADENGFTMLHREAIAGNQTVIAILLEMNADKNAQNKLGKTALDYAQEIGWTHVIEHLSK